MENLELFLSYLCGEFNNDEQVVKECKSGQVIHPRAKHVTGICNDKIKNLPKDFKGYFVIEESYYEQGNFKNTLPHLFLFTEDEEGNVVLTSYDLPNCIAKGELRNDNELLLMDYIELKVSERFSPMTYEFKDGGFEGESISYFTPETTFKLKERNEKGTLYVSEIFEKNGKVTFGCVDPIIYKRIK